MIEGLKVTIPGEEVLRLVRARIDHHLKRAKIYLEKKEDIGGDEQDEAFTKLGMSNDPRETLRRKAAAHTTQAEELEFIAKYLDKRETYLLDDVALRKLGILSTYW